MAIFALDDSFVFPPVHLAEPDGLLAIGGDLSPERLLAAYRAGIFPWYENPPILWWCPNPRFVLFPEELKLSKSLKPLLNREAFSFTINKDFKQVIDQCKTVPRAGQQSTWITDEIKAAYLNLHETGYAHSAEVWQDGRLAGGLYGVKIGKVFFGESMFSRVSNASRYALAKYITSQKDEIRLIDCQIFTYYLAGMGARMIDGGDFNTYLKQYCL